MFTFSNQPRNVVSARNSWLRLTTLHVQVVKVEEEEWSYVPVGGPLPKARQTVTAFGAAANLVRSSTD